MSIIHTASFYASADWTGKLYRVSRMHPRGLRTQWDTLPFLYPPQATLKQYRKGEIDVPQFTADYLSHLEDARESDQFRQLIDSMHDMEDFTVLCFEKTGTFCHRILLSEWLLKNVPGLRQGNIR